MAASSSSAAAAPVFQVWLHDSNGNRLFSVDVPVPMPAVVTFSGQTFAWSFHVYWRYVAVTPYAASADLGAPSLSVVSEPILLQSY